MPRQKSTHVDSPAAVGVRLKEARERAGLSQRQLAFPGCSPAYISRIEAGDRIPSLQLLRELGRRLGVTEDYLATGTEHGPGPETVLRDAELALRLDDLDTARSLYDRALADARDDRSRAAALEGLGRLEVRLGHPGAAVELLEQTLELGGGDPEEHPSLVETLARAYATVGELAPAIALLRRCVERYRENGDPIAHVRFACLLGYALTDNGDFAEAERVVAEALDAGRSIRDPYTRARLYWSRSRLLGEMGQANQAERHARRALEILSATEDTHAIGQAHQLLASLYIDSGRATEATDLLREAWPLIASTGTRIEVAQFRIEEARALAALGEGERAAAIAMDVAGALTEAEPLDAGHAFLLLARVFGELDEPARAQELFELSIERLEGQGPTRYLVEAYKELAHLLESQGRSDEALDLLKRALGVQGRAARPLA